VTVAAVAGARVAMTGTRLGHRYGGGRGLAPLSFRFESPGIVAVTGANGAGKSTLLRILAGLLRPSHGAFTLTCDGGAVPPSRRRRHVGYAASELAFYDEFTARENLAYAAEALGLEAPARAADGALARVGLTTRANDRVAALSSGMKQRLRLGFALLVDPEVLLLDEPGSHLDDDGRARVAALIAAHGERGLVVLATNDEREWRLAGTRCALSGRGLGDPA
jgi:heme exporter protein A